MLEGKHIVLGITGSIAAYKACTLIRLLQKRGAEVQVVITPSGKEFVTPLTLATLTGKPVVSEFFDRRDGSWHSHVSLGLWADLMLVAPCTAATLGKMAHGVADNMLVTTYLSMKAPVMIAPAMDLDMYAHPSTQANIDLLRSRGNIIIDAASGHLASNLEGKGRMQEPEDIAQEVEDFFTPKDMTGRKVLVTAGPTYERIDPVRFVGNHSSGKMGEALALECARRGAEVELIYGPVASHVRHRGITRTDVSTAQEMHDVAVALFPRCTDAILCAAVADFAPSTTAAEKIKTGDKTQGITLTLFPTPDIAQELGGMKRDGQRIVGFALETNDEEANARGKLERKGFDFIVLNSLRDKGAGFGTDTNKISIISATKREDFPLKAKAEVARDIVDRLV